VAQTQRAPFAGSATALAQDEKPSRRRCATAADSSNASGAMKSRRRFELADTASSKSALAGAADAASSSVERGRQRRRIT
jgi:hypothetical protein